MDGDGEDRPQDVPRLIDAFLGASPSRVVFAGRLRRSEGLLFRLGYWTFRQVHRFLVGIPVQFGNFSIIPASFLETLVVVSESWNHYAAAVLKARLPYAVVPTERGVRLAGQSHMRFPSLVAHGLNALSVFGEIICARALVFCVVMLCLLLAGSGGLIVFVKTGALSLSPWVLAGAAIVLVLVLQGIMGSFFLALILMFNRNNAGFLPIRDYRFFIRSAKCLQGELRSS